MMPGQKVRFSGESDQEPGAEAGDIIVVLMPKADEDGEEKKDDDDMQDATEEGQQEKAKTKKQRKKEREREKAAEEEKKKKGTNGSTSGSSMSKPKFIRLKNGTDLLIEKELTLVEALLGFQFAFKHLDDRIVLIKTPPGHVVAPEDVMMVEGEGMPIYKNPMGKGDLYMKCSIQMPKPEDLKDPKLRKALIDLLPKAPALPTDFKVDEAEEHIAKLFDAETIRNRQRDNARQQAENSYDSRDEDEGPRGGGTQCRQM
jgi:DnaJ-class molecular chaperone